MSEDHQPLINEQINDPIFQAEAEKWSENGLPASDFSENRNIFEFRQYIATITATLSALAAGIALGWTSPITADLENGKFHNISINKDQMGWIGSFLTLGATLTCIPYGFVCEKIGRKKALLLLIVPFGMGWLLILFANSLIMIYCGRFLTGIAAGGCCVAAPLYVGEIAQKEIRGTLGNYFQLMVTVGVFFAYLCGKFMNIFYYTIFCSLMPIIFFVTFAFQPESPIYTLKKGQIEKCKGILKVLRRSNTNIQDEINYLQRILQEDARSNVSLFESLQQTANKRALVISIALMLFQQFSGVNAVIFYTSNIFGVSNSKLDAKSASIYVGLCQVIATFVSSLIIEKLGRRFLLLLSEVVVGFSIIILGLFFTLQKYYTLTSLDFLPLVAVCLYLIAFSIGLGPIPWTITSEIFTPQVKSFATASSGTFNWLLAFVVTNFFLSLEVNIGTDTIFYVFGINCLIGFIFIYYFVPETKGKTTEEIQRILEL